MKEAPIEATLPETDACPVCGSRLIQRLSTTGPSETFTKRNSGSGQVDNSSSPGVAYQSQWGTYPPEDAAPPTPEPEPVDTRLVDSARIAAALPPSLAPTRLDERQIGQSNPGPVSDPSTLAPEPVSAASELPVSGDTPRQEDAAGRPALAPEQKQPADYSTVDSELPPISALPLPGTAGPTSLRPTLGQDDFASGQQLDFTIALPKVTGYQLLRELGRGGMGIVYQARQAGLNRIVAIKMIRSARIAGAGAVARFKAEAETVAQFQHPNIVQIYEVGEQDGDPYFSLEYVDGGCLADKVAGVPQEPREAAEIVRVLAEAMESAHRRGIIHRDLKPANVLLTRKGDLKITDFGLAKRFEENSGATREGAVVGTPSYMAPEQAEGKVKQLGPAADIYALGAILYDLVTGRPPFRAETLLQTLEQVILRPPVAPRRLHPRIPRDLEIITLKCLEKDPKKRYLTAGSLSDDLRRFLDGEPIHARPAGWMERTWKWARRRPTAAALIAVSVLALLALTAGGIVFGVRESYLRQEADNQRATAQNERDRAQRNFNRAWDAVQTLILIAQERLHSEPKMERVRRDLLVRALHFLEDFLDEKSTDPQVNWETARANLQTADIHHWLHEDARAEPAYRKALELLEGLVATPNTEYLPQYRYDMASTQNNLGLLLMSQNRFTEAEAAYARAEQLRRDLRAANPKDADNGREFARTLLALGELRQTLGRYPEALACYREAVQVLELLTLESSDPLYRLTLAVGREHLGDVLVLTGEHAAAEQAVRDAVQPLRELANQFHELPEYRDELVVACNRLGELLANDRPAEARAAYEEALTLAGGLAHDLPTVPIYRQHQAVTLYNLGKLDQVSGDFEHAEEHYRRQLEVSTQLATDFPNDPGLQRDRGVQLNTLGIFYLERNRRDDAGRQFTDAIVLFRDLTGKDPGVLDYHHELARTQANQAALLASEGKVAEAENAYEEAIRGEQELAGHSPQVPEYQAELARMQRDLGSLYFLSGQHTRVEHPYRDAITTYGRLRDRFPDIPDHRSQLAVTWTNLGTLLQADPKRYGDAEQAYAEAIALYEGLAKQLPGLVLYRRQLAGARRSLAGLLAAQAKYDAANMEYSDAIRLLQELVRDFKNVPALRQELARTFSNRAFLMMATKDTKRAEEDYRATTETLEPLPSSRPVLEDRAQAWTNIAVVLETTDRKEAGEKARHKVVECWRQIVREAPKDAAARERLASALYDLANAQANLDLPEALATLEDAAKHQRTASDLSHDARARGQLCKVLYRQAELLLKRQEHDRAAETITELIGSMPEKYEFRPGVAILLAQCVALARMDTKLDEPSRKQKVQAYGNLAMKVLRQAVVEGFHNPSALKTTDFEPLREREDFKKLVKDLGG